MPSRRPIRSPMSFSGSIRWRPAAIIWPTHFGFATLPESELVFRQSLNDYRTLASRFPNDVEYKWGVAMTLSNIGEVVDRLGRPKEALDLIDEARGIFHELAQKLNKDERFEQNRAHNDRLREQVRSASMPRADHSSAA